MTPSRLLTPKEQALILALSVAIVTGAGSLYFFGREAEPRSAVSATSGAPKPDAKAAAPRVHPPPLPARTPPSASAPPSGQQAQVLSPTDRAQLSSVTVSVLGAVARPRAYTLPSTARVNDLLRAADGLLPGADVSDVNLAARLIDGSTLIIPFKTTQRFQDGALTARGGQPAAAHNPPEYTLSGSLSAQAAPDASAVSEAPSDSDSPLLDLNTASAEELDVLPGIGPKLASEIVRYRADSPFQSVDDLLNVPGIGEKKAAVIAPLVTVSGNGP